VCAVRLDEPAGPGTMAAGVMEVFESVAPTTAEVARSRAGDELVPVADVVMDRAFSLPAPPVDVWPWIVQLGKWRGGWYLPRAVERWLPAGNRAAWHVEPRWQELAPGHVVPDYGGRHETFTVARIEAPHVLVYRSQRGRTDVSWAITLDPDAAGTRVSLRLRLAPVKHVRLASTFGGFFDEVTIAGMAAGLRERLAT
jgi:hypothetical protein